MIIVSEGFSLSDQQSFNTFTNEQILEKIFFDPSGSTSSPLNEDLNAFNIYRPNIISYESGITQLGENNEIIENKRSNFGYQWTNINTRQDIRCDENCFDNVVQTLDQLFHVGITL